MCKGKDDRSTRWSGFTLIELLIVVAVIAILAGLLFPALNDARTGAKTISCLYNLKQLSISTMNYTTDDNDNIIMLSTGDNTIADGVWGYLLQTRGYMTDNRVFFCPQVDGTYTYSKLGSGQTCVDKPSDDWRYWYICYGLNPSIALVGSSGKRTKLSNVVNPSVKVIIQDSRMWVGPSLTWRGCYTGGKSYLGTRHGRHPFENLLPGIGNGAMNSLYIDGHAGTIAATIAGKIYADNSCADSFFSPSSSGGY